MFVCSFCCKPVMKQLQRFFANVQGYLAHCMKLRLFWKLTKFFECGWWKLEIFEICFMLFIHRISFLMQRLYYAPNLFMHTYCITRIKKRDVNEVWNHILQLNIWANLVTEIQFTLISSIVVGYCRIRKWASEFFTEYYLLFVLWYFEI